MFYRNELREYLLAELRKAEEPLTARELAQRLCQVEGKDWQDRRLLTDVVRRVGCALRRLRASRVVEGAPIFRDWSPSRMLARVIICKVT